MPLACHHINVKNPILIVQVQSTAPGILFVCATVQSAKGLMMGDEGEVNNSSAVGTNVAT